MNSKNQRAWWVAAITVLLPGCALESSAEPSQPPLAVAPFDAATARQHQQAWAKHLGVEVEIENSIGMKLTLIPPGEFMMGSSVSAAVIHRLFPGRQVESYEIEHPRHKVRLTRAYYLSTHEVTVGDFERFVTATDYKTTAERERYAMGYYRDGSFRGLEGMNWRNAVLRQTSTHPVTCISWDDAVAFCQWLSRKEGRTYRLPTEAEWEYACRAGTDTLFFWGDDPDAGQGYLNAADSTGGPHGLRWPEGAFNFRDGYAATAPVGQFKANSFGLRDMLGNVGEWCSDWYGDYTSNPVDDPLGASTGSSRVVRGGSWGVVPGFCRSAFRSSLLPSDRAVLLGFRVALSFVDPFDSADSQQDPSEDAPRQNASLLEDVPRTAHHQSDSNAAGIPSLAIAPIDAATAKQHQQAWAKRLGVEVEIENSIGMKLTLIPPGEFMMGSSVSAAVIHRLFPGGEIEYYEDEHPRHKVRITRAYYLGTHEVTVADFERFVSATDYKTTAEKEGYAWGNKGGRWQELEGANWRNPGFQQTSTHPVTCISWDDAVAFCQWLSRKEGRTYRLPTEAEWEYACRAGTETLFFWSDDPDAGQGCLNGADLTGAPGGMRWQDGAFNFRDGYSMTAPVGRFEPNAFGLRDMLGNVSEWCSDWAGFYTSNPGDDPLGANTGSSRVVRGGSWADNARYCRSAYRDHRAPSYRVIDVGFRVALSSVDPSGQ